jgi:hypothetical protein
MTQLMPGSYCGHCGGEREVPGNAAAHDRCTRAVLLEPPRFCVQCRRRMLVQVTPTGWTAWCSRHGEVTDVPR